VEKKRTLAHRLLPLAASIASAISAAAYPIALDYHNGIDLYALDSSGTIRAVSMASKNYGVIRTIATIQLRPSGHPVDIVAYDAWNGENVVASELLGNNTVFHVYDPKAKQSQFTINKPCAGFDVDVPRQQIYAASSLGNEVIKIDLRTRQISTAARIDGAQSLGPVVIGVSAKSLFTADQRTGQIFQIELNTQRTQHIVGTVSQPVAMTFDEANQVLYVADASFGVIYRFPFGKARDLPPIATNLRELSGLAIGPNGTLFVSDSKFGRIEHISDKGIILETFPRFTAPLRLDAINAAKRLIESLQSEGLAVIFMHRVAQGYRDEEMLQKKHSMMNFGAPLPEPLKSQLGNMVAGAPKADSSDLTQVEAALGTMQDPQAQTLLKKLEPFGKSPQSLNFYPPQTVGDLDEFNQGKFTLLETYLSQAQYILRAAD
jgi:hypothetical protein